MRRDKSEQLLFASGKLLDYLKRSGIDATPVRDERGDYTGQLVLFFAQDKFVINVDPRTPNVWLKGVHDDEKQQ